MRLSRRRPDAHDLPFLHTSDICCAQNSYVTWTFGSASVRLAPSSSHKSVNTHRSYEYQTVPRPCSDGAEVFSGCHCGLYAWTAGDSFNTRICGNQSHHLVPQLVFQAPPGRCEAYGKMDRSMGQDHRIGQSSQYAFNTSLPQVATAFFTGDLLSPLGIFPAAEVPGATDYKPICDYWTG